MLKLYYSVERANQLLIKNHVTFLTNTYCSNALLNTRCKDFQSNKMKFVMLPHFNCGAQITKYKIIKNSVII